MTTLYALISPEGAINRYSSEYVRFDPSVPVKAGWSWLPVEDVDRPSVGPLETCSRKPPEVQSDRVIRDWLTERLSLDAQKQAVKDECQRRIMALMGADTFDKCIIKQLNANMRAKELNDIRHDREWTAEEAEEAALLKLLAATIKAIRAKSNEIELLDPIPLDFASDSRWGLA